MYSCWHMCGLFAQVFECPAASLLQSGDALSTATVCRECACWTALRPVEPSLPLSAAAAAAPSLRSCSVTLCGWAPQRAIPLLCFAACALLLLFPDCCCCCCCTAAQIVFSDAVWVGTAEDNPSEAPLPLPKELSGAAAVQHEGAPDYAYGAGGEQGREQLALRVLLGWWRAVF